MEPAASDNVDVKQNEVTTQNAADDKQTTQNGKFTSNFMLCLMQYFYIHGHVLNFLFLFVLVMLGGRATY